jgi:hypothetical protein
MSIQALTPPQDITWTRLAFSRDMIDTNFGDLAFSPKWRSSLAVYYYIVPVEETADAYANSRIVYLKLTCSITGFNPSEGLRNAKKAAEERGTLDDLQRTLWETIIASGWASKYWPCLGAILQIAVYPNNPTGVAPDDYPYILDFEPKKREMFEAVTEGSEFLSGTSDKISITKGSTSVTGMEYGASLGFSFKGVGAGASITKTTSDTTVNQNTTDTSKEARETLSRTTSSSQMYQLFNGYHLGTNRALFLVAPRPHTVSDVAQTEFNLIDGERKLEGVQDVFIVVHMPNTLDGFCIQASLDTGHQVTTNVPFMVMTRAINDDDPADDNPFPPDPPDPPPTTPIKQLVVTRRVIQSCGTFDENGNLHLRQLLEPKRPLVVGEIAVPELPTKALFRTAGGEGSKATRVLIANNMNTLQSRINRFMLDNASSVTYEPKEFEQTGVFKSLVAHSARTSTTPITELVTKEYVTRKTAEVLARRKITTLGELFSTAPAAPGVDDARAARAQVIDKLVGAHYR